MTLEKPANPNYAAVVVTLQNFVDLPGCDRVKGALIYGSQVIVSRDAQPGDRGLYFPVECALAAQFAGSNNLYRKPEWGNADAAAKGFFEQTGRVKCVKFRGHRSEGFWIPLSSLYPLDGVVTTEVDELPDGATFDTFDGVAICSKYTSKRNAGRGPSNQPRTARVEDRIVPGQFRFHYDTEKLARHLDWLTPDSIISVSEKFHGTSVVIANLLAKRRLGWRERLSRWLLGSTIRDDEYVIVWSSRKVIKGVGEPKSGLSHYYS